MGNGRKMKIKAAEGTVSRIEVMELRVENGTVAEGTGRVSLKGRSSPIRRSNYLVS